MKMVWLKACPRCHGDLFLDSDHYGKFKTCVQCGYARDLGREPRTAQLPRMAGPDEAGWLDLMAAAAD